MNTFLLLRTLCMYDGSCTLRWSQRFCVAVALLQKRQRTEYGLHSREHSGCMIDFVRVGVAFCHMCWTQTWLTCCCCCCCSCCCQLSLLLLLWLLCVVLCCFVLFCFVKFHLLFGYVLPKGCRFTWIEGLYQCIFFAIRLR